MQLSENDLDLLQEHLDNALDSAQSVALGQRLATDPRLVSALEEARAQLDLRREFFITLNPTDLECSQLNWRVRGAILDRNSQAAGAVASRFSPWRLSRWSSAVAACVVLGFWIGRINSSHDVQGPVGGSPVASIRPSGMGSFVASHDPSNPSSTPSTIGNTALVSNTTAAAPQGQFVAQAKVGKVMVPIVDPAYNRIVAYQEFDTPEQAKSFMEDLHNAGRVAGSSTNGGDGVCTVSQESQGHF